MFNQEGQTVGVQVNVGTYRRAGEGERVLWRVERRFRHPSGAVIMTEDGAVIVSNVSPTQAEVIVEDHNERLREAELLRKYRQQQVDIDRRLGEMGECPNCGSHSGTHDEGCPLRPIEQCGRPVAYEQDAEPEWICDRALGHDGACD